MNNKISDLVHKVAEQRANKLEEWIKNNLRPYISDEILNNPEENIEYLKAVTNALGVEIIIYNNFTLYKFYLHKECVSTLNF